MRSILDEFVAAAGLGRLSDAIRDAAEAAVGLSLSAGVTRLALGASKLGGCPDLPESFVWPQRNGRALDFLAQVNLAEVAQHDVQGALPRSGLLSFFYDLKEQPWGFSPDHASGSMVAFTAELDGLRSWPLADAACVLPECSIDSFPMLTVPHSFSRAGRAFEESTKMTSAEAEAYDEFSYGFEEQFFGSEEDGMHHLLGHAMTLHGDMRRQAQLVSNGVDCGGGASPELARSTGMEEGADEWTLLLQLDAEALIEDFFDCGRLFFWIRREHLEQRRFDQVWLIQQT